MKLKAHANDNAGSVPLDVLAKLSAAQTGPHSPPSQKELAGVFQITTRQLRRWETLEEKAGRHCGRPYSDADMWRLYQHKRTGCWDKNFASQVGLARMLAQFDKMRAREACDTPSNGRTSETAIMMLRCLACENTEANGGEAFISRVANEGLAEVARSQLRAILKCEQSCKILMSAFFEAALLADNSAQRR